MKTVYDVVIHLVEQLSSEEQKQLTDYLLLHLSPVDDDKTIWQKHFDELIDTTPMLIDFSNRREDWYDDDGR